MSSAAELALKKKFALLAKKKKEAASGGSNVAPAPAAPVSKAGDAAAQDPARLAAIRALQAKRAAAEAKASATPPAASPPGGAKQQQGTKLKLVIPKRQSAPAAQPGTQGNASAGATAPSVDPARAAALAALRARAAQQQQQVSGAAGQPPATSTDGQAGADAQQVKRPALKRPSVRPRPAQQRPAQAAPAAAAALGDAQQEDGGLGEIGGYSADGDHNAKRQRTEQQSSEGGEGEEGNATLFVGDLPQYWSKDDLLNYFAAEFDAEVLEARVIGSQCYGFVTFASAAHAEGVLAFAQQQGVWLDDRMLRVNWAQSSDGKKGPAVGGGDAAAAPEPYEHPRVTEARLQAQQLAASVDAQQIQALAMQPPPQRQMVSYEDL